MSLTIEPVTPPLVGDAAGGYRVRGTRIGLEILVYDFRAGASPEEIADRYDVLKLEDVYAVLAYYLAHRESVNAYVAEVEAEGDRIAAEIDPGFARSADLRRRLLARAASKD